VLVALADTHRRSDPRLTDHLRAAVANADCVIHAGDFTTTAVLDAFADPADRLVAVHGNSDDAAVQARLPATRTVDALGRRFLVVHGHEHGPTSLPLLARQEGADVAVVGHTHAAGIERLGGLVVVNPGSHAEPRGSRPAFATFEADAGGVSCRLRSPDGESFATERV
jgi:putative phosphoesterase